MLCVRQCKRLGDFVNVFVFVKDSHSRLNACNKQTATNWHCVAQSTILTLQLLKSATPHPKSLLFSLYAESAGVKEWVFLFSPAKTLLMPLLKSLFCAIFQSFDCGM